MTRDRQQISSDCWSVNQPLEGRLCRSVTASGCEPSQLGTTRLATRPIQQSDPERAGQITPLAPAKLPRCAILDSFVHKIVTVSEKLMKLLMKLSNYPTNFATQPEFAYTPNSTCYTIFKTEVEVTVFGWNSRFIDF